MPTIEPRHFTRDPSLATQVADHFGGSAANAEQLVLASQLSRKPALDEAQLHGIDHEATADLERSDVASAVDVDEKHVLDFAVRGDYVVVVLQVGDVTTKDVLAYGEDGSLETIEDPDSPQQAALRAQVASARAVSDARSEAEKIVAEAQQKAQEILAEAAAAAKDDAQESVRNAQEKAAEDDGGDAESKPSSGGSRSGSRKKGAKES